LKDEVVGEFIWNASFSNQFQETKVVRQQPAKKISAENEKYKFRKNTNGIEDCV
jgi:hypothetical protein